MSPTLSPRAEVAASHLVTKIGGSLWSSPLLPQWLAALRQYPSRLTIVPGGGPFADMVRKAQVSMRFSDGAAHAMALLAMEQYAFALADLDASLEPVCTPEQALDAHHAGRIALWRPLAMVQGASEVPMSWDITSDSLAAWCAKEFGSLDLLLIKSVDVELGDDLALRGLVDPCFPQYAREMNVFIAGPSDIFYAAEIFSRGGVPGANVASNLSRQKITS